MIIDEILRKIVSNFNEYFDFANIFVFFGTQLLSRGIFPTHFQCIRKSISNQIIKIKFEKKKNHEKESLIY